MKAGFIRYRLALMVFAFILIPIWLHARLLDGLDGLVLGWFLSEDTHYANGYSDAAFRRVRRGMVPSEVVALIGQPIAQSWTYEKVGRDPIVVFFNEAGRLRHVAGENEDQKSMPALDSEASRVLAELGSPTLIAYRYSESPTDGHYRVRSVVFRNGVVDRIINEFWWD